MIVCSCVFPVAGSLDWAVGGRCDRKREETGVGSDVEESRWNCRGGMLRNEELWKNPHALQLVRAGDGRMIGIRDTCPEDDRHIIEFI